MVQAIINNTRMLGKTSSSAAWIQCTRSAGIMFSGNSDFCFQKRCHCFSSDRSGEALSKSCSQNNKVFARSCIYISLCLMINVGLDKISHYQPYCQDETLVLSFCSMHVIQKWIYSVIHFRIWIFWTCISPVSLSSS